MWKKMAGAFCALGLLAMAPSASPRQIVYPEGYRSWVHVKSALNDPAHAPFGRYRGMYHIYANAPAVQGYRTGTFPDGAIIVFALHDVATTSHNTASTQRRFIDVMEKDSRSFPATGGWGYEEFAAGTDQRLSDSAPALGARCHACHATQAGRGFVYSRIVE